MSDARRSAEGAGGEDDYVSRSVPSLPLHANIRPDLFNPLVGVPSAKQPEYLDFNVGGRSWFERMVYNTGSLYLLGSLAGGAFGLVEGFRTAPSSKFNIRLNSIMNKTGRRGSRLGNALGSVAFLYSCVEGVADYAQLDRVTGQDWLIPAASALATGVIYKSTAGPKTVALAGALGASLALSSYAAKSAFPQLGLRKGVLFF